MSWPQVQLRYMARFAYGDALPTDEVQAGPFDVFGSNGSYGNFGRANTLGPVIVVGRKGSYGKVNWTHEPCFASDTTFFVDASMTQQHLRWLYWLLQTLRLDEGSDEAAVPGLNREQAYSRRVSFPPPKVQVAIADFLDRETARLDALVAAKKRVLDLLAEKRKALIATAVTRGLDPRVKLRDSGVGWLGEIPAHWELVPIRYLLDFGPKNGISPQQSGADGALSFSISAVRDGSVTIDGNEKFVVLEPSVARGYYLKPGDILLVRGNGNLSLVGTCGLLEVVPDECTYPDILMLMRVGQRIISELLVAAVNAPYVRQQIESLAQTTNGTYKLSGEDVKTLQIALPPLDEQHTIVAHIARETAKLDAVRAATERTIALLKERRAALIAAAVTGQLDVGAMPRASTSLTIVSNARALVPEGT